VKKRDFIKSMGLVGLSPLLQVSPSLNKHSLPTAPLLEDEFWELVRSHYELHPDFINLESGYYNITPKPTLAKYMEHIKRVNLEGSYYMRNNRFKDKDSIMKN